MNLRSNCCCPADSPGYEDSYGAWEMPDFDTMRTVFKHSVEPGAPWAALNIPIWIDHKDGEVLVGVFLVRHGDSVVWTATATVEQVAELREIMAQVWIGRIDAGLPRYKD